MSSYQDWLAFYPGGNSKLYGNKWLPTPASPFCQPIRAVYFHSDLNRMTPKIRDHWPMIEFITPDKNTQFDIYQDLLTRIMNDLGVPAHMMQYAIADYQHERS